MKKGLFQKLFFPLSLIGLGIAYVLSKKRTAQNLRFEPGSIKVNTEKTKSANFFRIYIDIAVNIINNEAQSVNINAINLQISADNKKLGDVINNDGFIIQPKTNKLVNFSLELNSLSSLGLLVGYIKNAIKGDVKQKPINIIVDGFADTDLGRVNINFNRNLNVFR